MESKTGESVELPDYRATGHTGWLTGSLFAYQGEPNTVRKVHSSRSQFFAYCTDMKASTR